MCHNAGIVSILQLLKMGMIYLGIILFLTIYIYILIITIISFSECTNEKKK